MIKKRFKITTLILLVLLCLFCFVSACTAQENREGIMVIKVKQQKMALTAKSGGTDTILNGEIVYKISETKRGIVYELNSLNMTGTSINVKDGASGPISIILKPKTARSTYDLKKRVIQSEFIATVHYPLIDQLKGYIKPKEGEREIDEFRSYTETFSGSLICALSESPRIGTTGKIKTAAIVFKTEVKEAVLGEIVNVSGKMTVLDVQVIFPPFYFKKVINIQPVFVRYTPETGCFGGTTKATTGGSYNTLKENAMKMWNRCCLGLNFLPPAYIDNNDYRILSSTEEANLMATYNNANAVEVFFVEVGDPVGLHGGGVCYSGGTANTKIITYDTNLPINLYNLAHELGHALNLSHPPGNSTPGSLMEPSGFCADNPALMSNQNCDNASNPLFYYVLTTKKCTRNINMP
jgi:hypothetical protein